MGEEDNRKSKPIGRNDLDTARVFSGLLMVIIIGLLVESVIFRAIESRTVNLWGMQR